MRGPCQALVVRYAPDPSAGEVLNIGVVVLAPAHGFFGARFVDSWQRITQAFPRADLVHLRRVASAVERACAAASGAQLRLDSTDDIVAAFHAIIPPDDASLQHSSPLSGVTSDPERTLDELFGRYVTERAATPDREPRRDHEVWREVMTVLRRHGVLGRLQSRTLKGRHYEEQFEAAWRNGVWNVAKPLSLDLLDPHAIVTKAASWTGRIIALEPEKQSSHVHLVIGVPPASAPAEVRQASEDGLGLLAEKLEDLATVVRESEVDELAVRIEHDLEHAADGDE